MSVPRPGAALITGGARRLGREIALYLAEHGYDIALHYHQAKNGAEATANEIRGLGVRCELFCADLADPKTHDLLIIDTYKVFPELNVLVNNASIFEKGELLDSNLDFYHSQTRINVDAPIFLTQAFAKHIKRGAVVNMLDARINQNAHYNRISNSNPKHFFYLLSKKTLAEFTCMAALSLAPNIRVNGVCPGHILALEGGNGYSETLISKIPLQHTATPKDIAQAVHMLITTQSLTGQLLFVDGGEHLL